MKAVVYGDLTALPAGRRAGKRSGRANLRFQVPRQGRIDEPVYVLDSEVGHGMVRLLRDVSYTSGLYQGSKIVKVKDVFLDGTVRVDAYTADRKHHIQNDEDVMPSEQTIRAARTNNTIDFGRFEQACTALMLQVDDARQHPDDEERQESVFRAYQGMLAWREDLTRQVAAVDSSLDVVAAKIRSMVQ